MSFLPLPPSKPPVKVESRDPHSIRFTPAEWSEITDAALAHGIEPSRFARQVALTGLRLLPGIEAVEAYRRITAGESA